MRMNLLQPACLVTGALTTNQICCMRKFVLILRQFGNRLTYIFCTISLVFVCKERSYDSLFTARKLPMIHKNSFFFLWICEIWDNIVIIWYLTSNLKIPFQICDTYNCDYLAAQYISFLLNWFSVKDRFLKKMFLFRMRFSRPCPQPFILTACF